MKFSTFAVIASAALVAAAPAPQVEEVSTVIEEVTSFFEVTVTVTGVEPTGEATTTTVAEELTTTAIDIPEYPEETTEVETVTDYPTLDIPTLTVTTTSYPILNSTIVVPTYTINGTNPIITVTPPAPTSTDDVPPPSEGAATVGRTVGLGAAAAGVFALVAGLL